MNRISVLAAAGAVGVVALTAGCSSGTSNGASTSAATAPGSATTGSSASTAASSASPASSASSTPSTTPASAGGGTSPNTAPTTAHSTAPTHAGVAACTTAEMPSGTWRVVPDSEGAGHVAADIALRNTSGHSCTVTGFPAISLLASNDRQLPTKVLKDNSIPITTVTVAPGGWVHAEMRYSANIPGPGEPTSGQCEPMTVHALAQLPGASAWSHITLADPTPVCEKGQLQVKPFVSGEASPNGG